MTEITTTERIQNASSQNSSLLRTLFETEHGSPALYQAQAYQKDLLQSHGVQTTNLKKLQISLSKEQKEHEAYRDSTMKRLAHRAVGKKEKFASKAEKEEKEYLEAVQAHFAAKQQLAHHEGQMRENEAQIEELKRTKMRHDAAQMELENLYNSIFEGPTPDFPQEDEWENKVNALRHDYGIVQQKLSAANQALAILQDAQKFLRQVLNDLNSARSSSQMDLWGVGGSFADYAERSALSSAQMHTTQVGNLIGQARRLQPAIRDVGPMRIAQGHVMSDIIFDNIFSDMNMHEEIKASLGQCQLAGGRMETEIGEQRKRADELKSRLGDVGNQLATARKELEDVRKSTFERVAGGLPDYSA